ncbi:MAG: hypothetical protein ACRC76_00230 [Proteocatella sp.]
MMQAANEMSQGKVRLLSVAGGSSDKEIGYMTDGWKYNIPVLKLVGTEHLRYTRKFPAFVVIGKDGKRMSCNIETKEDLLKVTKMLCEEE